MRRMACVDVPALPLQLLLRRHPEWKELPAAVVESDRPQALIRWVNQRARDFRILPGIRYAAALSLCGSLRAAAVPSWEIERAVRSLVERLGRFSPRVEPARDAPSEPGVFWLDASGLEGLHPSLDDWARRIRASLLRHETCESTVVVGYSKFATLAIARAVRGIRLLEDPADEDVVARRVPLERLGIEPAVRDVLGKLGVHTVGEFIALPPEGIEKRFGASAWRLYREARGELRAPVAGQTLEPPLSCELHLDDSEVDAGRLLQVIERLLRSLLETLEGGRGVAEVRLGLHLEGGGDLVERIRPATPTRELAQLVELIRLRLASIRLPDRVSDVSLSAEAARIQRRQLELFEATPARDLGAANRALARIRAEFGETAVTRARLREGHLPEAKFSWEPLERLALTVPGPATSPGLVRRVYTHPLMLPPRPRHEPDGWMLRGLEQGPVVRVLGPYIVSGGWWRRTVHREYHFAETQRGELLWLYYDRLERRWFIQGRVE